MRPLRRVHRKQHLQADRTPNNADNPYKMATGKKHNVTRHKGAVTIAGCRQYGCNLLCPFLDELQVCGVQHTNTAGLPTHILAVLTLLPVVVPAFNDHSQHRSLLWLWPKIYVVVTVDASSFPSHQKPPL